MGCWPWAGGVRIELGCCERLALRGGTRIRLIILGAMYGVMFYLMFCVCVQCTAVQEAALAGNKPHIRHGGLSRVPLCYQFLHLHMVSKVGYKRSDMYGTLLAKTPHLNIDDPPPKLHLQKMIRYPLRIQFARADQKRGVTAGKHVMLASN